MRRRCVVWVMFVGVLLFSGTAFAGEMGRYLVTIRGSIGKAVQAAQGRVIHEYNTVSGVAIELPAAAVAGLERNPNVVSIQPDIVVTAMPKGGKKPPKGGGDKEQPAEVLEWNVDRIDADLSWSLSKGEGVGVAVVDTGIDKDHPDLAANIIGGVNFVAKGRRLNPDKWDDDSGHGTHVAGIIAAVDNEIGVIGVAPDAGLYAVKVLDQSGNGWLSDVVAGIEWAVDNNADVINLSLGASSSWPLLNDACQAAADSGVLIVAAAGNDGGDVLYPARYDSVIAVGATDSSDTVPWWSNRGPEVELAAPGVGVRSTWKGDSYNTISGTSMATPHVAGTCALMLGSPEPLPPNGIRVKLQETAEDLEPDGKDDASGYGLVDAEKAVTAE